MTNDQNAMGPERIWTWSNATHPDAGGWVSDSHHKDDDCGQHEYIRRDIYDAVVNDRNRLRLELDYAKRQLAQGRREALLEAVDALQFNSCMCGHMIRKLIEKEGGG